jgi:hypothetical protein
MDTLYSLFRLELPVLLPAAHIRCVLRQAAWTIRHATFAALPPRILRELFWPWRAVTAPVYVFGARPVCLVSRVHAVVHKSVQLCLAGAAASSSRLGLHHASCTTHPAALHVLPLLTSTT